MRLNHRYMNELCFICLYPLARENLSQINLRIIPSVKLPDELDGGKNKLASLFICNYCLEVICPFVPREKEKFEKFTSVLMR